MENQVISREYVEKNYIHKNVLEKFIEDNIFYAGNGSIRKVVGGNRR